MFFARCLVCFSVSAQRITDLHILWQPFTEKSNLSSTYKCNFLGADNKQ